MVASCGHGGDLQPPSSPARCPSRGTTTRPPVSSASWRKSTRASAKASTVTSSPVSAIQASWRHGRPRAARSSGSQRPPCMWPASWRRGFRSSPRWRAPRSSSSTSSGFTGSKASAAGFAPPTSKCWRWRTPHRTPIASSSRNAVARWSKTNPAQSSWAAPAWPISRRKISDDIGAPVIEGVSAAVKIVESIVALGLGTSKVGDLAYPLSKPYSGSVGHLSADRHFAPEAGAHRSAAE